MKISKRVIAGVMGLSLVLCSGSAFAYDYANSTSFEGKVLPESSGNTSLGTKTKTTSRSYGKVKITSYSNCKKVSCWFRTKTSDGNYHYWTPYIQTISDKDYHRVSYSDSSSAFYKKGVSAALRAENATQALDWKTEKVSGTIYFN